MTLFTLSQEGFEGDYNIIEHCFMDFGFLWADK